MESIAVWVKIDGERVADALQETREKLDSAQGEVALDFSSVRRINPAALRALETLADSADEKAVKVVLRGVNVDIYKVLKLAKVASRFSFRELRCEASSPERVHPLRLTAEERCPMRRRSPLPQRDSSKKSSFSGDASYSCADLSELIGSQTALGRHFQIG